MDLKSILESILFVNEKPILIEEIAEALDLEKKEVLSSIEQLKKDYEERGAGLCIVGVAGGYQMCASPQNSDWIKKLYKERFKHRLSSASLEVLAVIAYKQPVTRLEIEAIRGVNCEQVLKGLMGIGLVKVKGRKDVIGRPFLYGTSRKFLEYFGLNSLGDLPKLEKEQPYGNGLKEAISPQNLPGDEQEAVLENQGESDGVKEVTEEN
ncbi:MAG: SMC-Scp complex subunit ScpB [Candidatus Omnitrophica bacterium]|nr:SMC-Scp complex subunit ScpB [Candidatus Omnitrophota bacterium]